jgi:hypothetical protein
MYVILVLLQTLLLPLVSGIIQLALAGGKPLVVFGIWWAFWGVGTRLLVAGISQIVNPARTAQGILGNKDAGAELVVHELGYANLSMGLIGMATAFVPGWGIFGSLAGAIFLGLAGLRHVAKRGKNRNENVATWTDLLVFIMVVLGVIGTVSAALHA